VFPKRALCSLMMSAGYLNLAGEKNMPDISMDHFKKLTRKAEIPKHLVLETVRKTVATTLEKWNENKMAYDLPAALRKQIDQHMSGSALARPHFIS